MFDTHSVDEKQVSAEKRAAEEAQRKKAELDAYIKDFVAKLVIGFVVTFALCAWAINFHLGSIATEKSTYGSGTFGDSFGVVNSLFTGLAFLGVIVSVVMQREELKLARKDRRDTKRTLEHSQQLFKIQEENIKHQNNATTKQMFEATFFQMFTAFNDVTREIQVEFVEEPSPTRKTRFTSIEEVREDLKRRTKKVSGRDAFEVMNNRFANLFNVQLEIHQTKGIKSTDDGVVEDNVRSLLSEEQLSAAYREAYTTFFKSFGDDLGRYFRTLYTIMSFVQTAKIADQERKTYIKFIRAQLSMHEATTLMLNFLSPYTTYKFNDLCASYGMGKNADWNNAVLTQMDFKLPFELRGVSEWVDRKADEEMQMKMNEAYLYDNDESDGN